MIYNYLCKLSANQCTIKLALFVAPFLLRAILAMKPFGLLPLWYWPCHVSSVAILNICRHGAALESILYLPSQSVSIITSHRNKSPQHDWHPIGYTRLSMFKWFCHILERGSVSVWVQHSIRGRVASHVRPHQRVRVQAAGHEVRWQARTCFQHHLRSSSLLGQPEIVSIGPEDTRVFFRIVFIFHHVSWGSLEIAKDFVNSSLCCWELLL